MNQAALKKIIERSKLVSKGDLLHAQKASNHLGCSLVEVLLGRNLLKEEDYVKILSKYYKTKAVDLKKTHILQKVLNLIPEKIAAERGVIAFGQKGREVFLAMEDPRDLELTEIIRKTIGSNLQVVPHVATKAALKEALKLYKKKVKEDVQKREEVARPTEASVVTIVDRLVEEAVSEEASDIHMEPLDSEVLARFRIDGVLHDRMVLPRQMHSSLAARVKVLAELKLDEQRHPQDGRFPFQTKRGEKISLRVSTIPTVHGEKIVLRILHDTLTRFNLEDLGLLAEDLEIMEHVLTRTHGMFLITGPTGSGKTTTLYTLLGLLNRPDFNIMTIEDPVENRIRRINQIQVNPQINLDFAQGLRATLRQDPDIIMVGEIRDKETAVIAVNAAMTGHLVLSSVHANDAAGIIPRMIDLGVEPFLLSSTLNIVVAQRLVRILCPKCKEEAPLNPLLERRLAGLKERISPDIRKRVVTNFLPKGCPSCYHSGFRGRVGIFELMLVTDSIKDLIVTRSSSNSIWREARKDGLKTMLEDGLIKVARGLTSIEEVLRVISN